MTVPFVGFHFYLILKNRTTLEFFAILTRHTNAIDAAIFDQGYSRNWKDVFGPSVSDWLVPTATMIGKTKYVVKKRSMDV